MTLKEALEYIWKEVPCLNPLDRPNFIMLKAYVDWFMKNG